MAACLYIYLTGSVVNLFLFIVQQVHTQPVVTATSSISSMPTSTPEEATVIIRLSLVMYTSFGAIEN